MEQSTSTDRMTSDETGKLHRSGTMVGATHSTAERIHKAADSLREKSAGNSVTNRIAGNAATAMDQAATYIDEFSTERLRDDFGALVRKRPLQSMAVGVLFGFIAARLIRR